MENSTQVPARPGRAWKAWAFHWAFPVQSSGKALLLPTLLRPVSSFSLSSALVTGNLISVSAFKLFQIIFQEVTSGQLLSQQEVEPLLAQVDLAPAGCRSPEPCHAVLLPWSWVLAFAELCPAQGPPKERGAAHAALPPHARAPQGPPTLH